MIPVTWRDCDGGKPIMDTSDSGGGSGGSGIAHTRGEGNSGYSIGVNGAGVGM